eukprot:13285209-Alexandrium_andersonii.AAC.1
MYVARGTRSGRVGGHPPELSSFSWWLARRLGRRRAWLGVATCHARPRARAARAVGWCSRCSDERKMAYPS